MALLLNYNLNGDLLLTNAYLSILDYRTCKDPVRAAELGGGKWVIRDIKLAVKPAKGKNTQDVWSDERWVFATTPPNIGGDEKAQVYNYLKTLLEFSGATDDND